LRNARKPYSLKLALGAGSVWGGADIFYLEKPPKDKYDCAHTWSRGKYCIVTTGSSAMDQVTRVLDFPLVGPELFEWGTSSSSPRTNRVRLSDGVVDDYMGLTDVLVRNVEHSVVFMNTETPLCTADKWNPANNTDEDIMMSCIVYTIPILFGVFTRAPQWGLEEDRVEKLQIFKRSHFVPFVQMLQTNQAKNNTAVARMNLTTVGNTYWGIPANRTIDLAMFYLSSSPEFVSQLPDDTQRELQLGDKGIFANFPHYKTSFQNAPISFNELRRSIRNSDVDLIQTGFNFFYPHQIHLLSALTSWAVQRNEDLIRDMFE